MTRVYKLIGKPHVLCATALKCTNTPLNIPTREIFEEYERKPENAKQVIKEFLQGSPQDKERFENPLEVEEFIRKYLEHGHAETKELIRRIWGFKHKMSAEFDNSMYVFEPVSRFLTLYMWNPMNIHGQVIGRGLEASLRLLSPVDYERVDGIDKLWDSAVAANETAKSEGIPVEDRRFVRPLCARTRVALAVTPRYAAKIYNNLSKVKNKEFEEVGTDLGKIIEEDIGFIPDDRPAYSWSSHYPTDAVLKGSEYEEPLEPMKIEHYYCSEDMSCEYLVATIRGSLAMYGQMVRNAQVETRIEPWTNILKRSEFVVPRTFENKPVALACYKKLQEELSKAQLEAGSAQRLFELPYFFSMGQEAVGRIVASSHDAIKEVITHRACQKAMWEIRDNIFVPLSEELNKRHGKRIYGPDCKIIHDCSESKRFVEGRDFKYPIILDRETGKEIPCPLYEEECF